jgi:hypothetical protein
MIRCTKLTPDRLARKAIVYLRHSSERQVQQNLESQRLQYALADRARALVRVTVQSDHPDRFGVITGIGAT